MGSTPFQSPVSFQTKMAGQQQTQQVISGIAGSLLPALTTSLGTFYGNSKITEANSILGIDTGSFQNEDDISSAVVRSENARDGLLRAYKLTGNQSYLEKAQDVEGKFQTINTLLKEEQKGNITTTEDFLSILDSINKDKLPKNKTFIDSLTRHASAGLTEMIGTGSSVDSYLARSQEKSQELDNKIVNLMKDSKNSYDEIANKVEAEYKGTGNEQAVQGLLKKSREINFYRNDIKDLDMLVNKKLKNTKDRMNIRNYIKKIDDNVGRLTFDQLQSYNSIKFKIDKDKAKREKS